MHFVSATCEGERCGFRIGASPCGAPATHKVGEEVADDDPNPHRHNLTQYVCCEHFRTIVGPAAPCEAPVDETWWPANPSSWPEYAAQDGMRYGTSEALALLILHDVVHPMASCQQHDPRGSPTIMVGCNDLFWWATADAEALPPLGFGQDWEAPFWDLYDRVRRDGARGAEVWCCLRRKMRPQTPIEKEWREQGLWTAELEALPARDPKECG